MNESISYSEFPSARWHEFPLLGRSFYHSEVLERFDGLQHVFTPIGYNMSIRSGAHAGETPDRQCKLCEALSLDYDQLICGTQVHGRQLAGAVSRSDSATINHIVKDTGQGLRVVNGVDGFVTDQRNIPIMALSADCSLLVVYDDMKKAVGLAHSGWRGTLDGMPQALVERMFTDFGSEPKDLTAVIAPAARACCYEVQEDVREKLAEVEKEPDAFLRYDQEKMYLDIPRVIAAQLLRSGIAQKNIHLPEQCTICNEGFFSYRRQGPNNGHAGLIVCLT